MTASVPPPPPTIRAPRGRTLSCQGWVQEAALRMLMNNLDPDVAEQPEALIVYGGTGKAARSWPDFHRIVAALRRLRDDETLLVQSGRAVGVLKTHPDAPRVLISNAMLVPKWGTWEEFRRLEALGLTMYGQMTAGSWIYIGSQGILQGTYETFAAVARQHFAPAAAEASGAAGLSGAAGASGEASLRGRLVVSGGLGGMGGAQPLAATMNEGVFLGADVDRARIEKRLRTRYCDRMTEDLDEGIDWALAAQAAGTPLSIGVVANITELLNRLLARRIVPDVLTDQTSAHDPLTGYVPDGMSLAEALALRAADPERYARESFRTMAEHVAALLELQRRGAVTFDYGNNLRGHAREAVARGLAPRAVAGSDFDPFRIPGFVPAYIRPLFCEGSGPFRWAALSGEPDDIAVTDDAVLEAFPEEAHLCRWIRLAREKVAFQGLPARICWLKYGQRARLGLIFNELVRSGRVSAPLVIGRDHLDCGSVASPNRETEGMLDGSDAIADWPILNALANTACGASWVSLHHGGGVGIGYSIHAGQVIVADGTPEAARRLERVLTADPALGVLRHADAGYELARTVARERGVDLAGP